MSTDSTQVMRVLDRCLDTAPTGSDTVPGMTAAATVAKADPTSTRPLPCCWPRRTTLTPWSA
jgi:hypothetical protein